MPINIFCCYAHEDEALLKKLKSHMRMLQRQGLIHIWHDQDITAGTEREQAISKHLDEAQIILLLVSPDFINSEYCYSTEMQRAMVRYEAGTAHVIPIMLRPTDRRGTPFEKLQPLPSESKPVTSWRNRDEAFLAITQGIRKAVEQLHSPEESSEPFAAEKNTSKPNLRLKKEELTALSNSTASTAVLYIPLLAESLVIDSHQLKKNLQNLYDCDVKEVKVQIDMFEFSANLSEIVEKFCREIERMR
ncbi:MAG TPA: toll/interleukin-1 receptor domain-containing protein [Ktedonobacteraceae bacterium]|nr:toll/interleukin-1 receptor domain-containing protein [Ktedonobacteraceae bacterium]